jgi:hypothetical protein
MSYFSQPYGLRDAALWFVHNVAGPSARHAGLTRNVPSGTIANPICPKLTMAFVGDVLPFRGTRFRVSEELRAFLAAADVLVANFEGTIVEGRPPHVFMGQPHSPDVVDFLADLFPPNRTVLTCANNHAADYGAELFARSQELLAAAGFRTIGSIAAPGILIDGVEIAAGTDWMNRPAAYVQRLDYSRPTAAAAGFRVLVPHWGHELEAAPRPRQIQQAAGLLKQWDMIVGHHSHCPQPVSLLNERLVAYSLGNFTFGYSLRHHLRGLVLKVSVGPHESGGGRWAAGRIEWRPITIGFEQRLRGCISAGPHPPRS